MHMTLGVLLAAINCVPTSNSTNTANVEPAPKENEMDRITDFVPSKTAIVAMTAILWIAMTLGTAFAG